METSEITGEPALVAEENASDAPRNVQDMARYTTREMRENCYKARNVCFKCLDKNSKSKCLDICDDFLSGRYCLKSWIKHFAKQRKFDRRYGDSDFTPRNRFTATEENAKKYRTL